uniref:toll/interleukin-1 receptor domain-containing protein n=1 Tax=Streptomyces clavuligerus TaxID=1901 RepID=UPI00280ACE59
MTQVFISHSAKRDPLTLEVLQRVASGLTSKNFEVRVDMEALRPGVDWCATLYQWLAECDAAVVLFNEAALESFWVRREVNILLWRRALNPRFRVIPVLVGKMSSGRLKDAGFSDVLPVEFAREPPGGGEVVPVQLQTHRPVHIVTRRAVLTGVEDDRPAPPAA